MPARKPLTVIVNKGGGAASRAGDALVDQVEAAFAAADCPVTVAAVAGKDIASCVEKAAKSGTVVVGGGDGTLGSAAALLVDTKTTLGILPLGTRNHLARELGIPMDLPGAARIIADGHKRRIDLSSVNDHIFVNNASIGLYPAMVRAREDLQERHGLPKWIANLPAGWHTLGTLRHHRLRVAMDGAPRPIRTPLLFVGNNVYSLDLGKVGQRDALDDGKLSVFAVAPNSRAGLIGFGLRAMIGRTEPGRDFATVGVCETMTLSARANTIEVATDGEILRLKTPLTFKVLPRALEVFAA
ncbi:diacylglycerol kinase family protein [Sphingomonas sp.]|uniref:diacylglycerol/lipid kinase family protein n=1 Tax=Sphingomonas sp. TaxID=28214 RepID=UPI0025FF33D0|nr:diacylglycerol kinase family protein [Sphingomonas sp.]